MNVALAAPHASGLSVEVEVADAEAIGDPLWTASPEEGAHPRQQFGNGEGLDDIVVRTDQQTANAFRLFAPGGHHDHRKRAGALAGAEPAADLQTRDAGKHPVENDKIGRILRKAKLGFVAPLHAFDDVAFGLQIVGEQNREIGLVLHDENARS